MSSQRIKNADACTINDVMVALIAGMWRRYLVHRRDPCVVGSSTSAAPKQLQIRALVPYSFPRSNAPADRDAMRNRWCFLSLALPVEVAEDKPRTLRCSGVFDSNRIQCSFRSLSKWYLFQL